MPKTQYSVSNSHKATEWHLGSNAPYSPGHNKSTAESLAWGRIHRIHPGTTMLLDSLHPGPNTQILTTVSTQPRLQEEWKVLAWGRISYTAFIQPQSHGDLRVSAWQLRCENRPGVTCQAPIAAGINP
eukprot:scpid50181/ scgid17784/ 